ncbi:MAG TPA: hypothetical protein VM370_00280 [Candidatus Thermoplasmatota archaeon]|nr:hypothetical protein [Candidatus Thermoplasmatota archaeon]
MRTWLVILSWLAIIASPAAYADCEPTTSQPEIDAFGFYVDNDSCFDCFITIWIYQESNLIPGLQRGDELHDDTCGGMIASDRIVF